ncbi:hypothetical protein OPT61_g6397 [Boeremia exigua]|uniref:Uncharacterized protein n=1 Tax=Boeremia exigua TaxID=749465 RepID=A0ACC2I6T0_9PLEO|nr:hypothetical protein OPT61_g6397 [Boeremia exigua]
MLSIIRKAKYNIPYWKDQRYVLQLEVTTLDSQMELWPTECSQSGLALLQIGSWQRYDEDTGSGIGYTGGWGRDWIALLGPEQIPGSLKISSFITDFSWMQAAVLACSQHHTDCLSKDLLSVPGLRVIDCSASSAALSIVLLPESGQYAALSYVWGLVYTDRTEYPAVIADAVKVTRELGLRYLWVDKYCIDSSDKHRLIGLMDLIYSKAYVTIVAAPGNPDEVGLPGIGTSPRVEPREINISGCTLLELPCVIDATQASRWAKRGWTYQEGILSTRCLVFTDRGVLYHCRNRYVEEPWQCLVPPEATVSKEWPNLDHTYLFASKRTEYSQVKERITQYTQRDLSMPEDSLNASLGIFADTERRSMPPISPSSTADCSVPNPPSSHIWGLPLRDGAPQLDWYHSAPAKSRRSDFPSWSWCGWEGGIEFGDTPFTV